MWSNTNVSYRTNENEVNAIPNPETQSGYVVICLLSMSDPYFRMNFGG